MCLFVIMQSLIFDEFFIIAVIQNLVANAIKLNARSFQFIVQITLFQLQFLIQYRKFPISVGPNLYIT